MVAKTVWKARILVPKGNQVFYNPVQVLNRDLRCHCDHVMCVLYSLDHLGSFWYTALLLSSTTHASTGPPTEDKRRKVNQIRTCIMVDAQ